MAEQEKKVAKQENSPKQAEVKSTKAKAGMTREEEMLQGSAGSSREPLRYAPEFQIKLEEVMDKVRSQLKADDDETPVDAAKHDEVWGKLEEDAGDDRERAELVRTAKLNYYNRHGAL